MSESEIIETIAGEVSAELAQTIDPNQELIAWRRETRARVSAAGLTDDDIDRMIRAAQSEVEPHRG